MGEQTGELKTLDDAYRRLNESGRVPAEVFYPDGGLEQEAADELRDRFERFTMRPTELVGQEGDKIVLRVWVMATRKGSRPGTRPIVRRHVFHVWTMHDGKPVSWHSYSSRSEALEAVH